MVIRHHALLGKTTARSQVRRFIRSKAATPFIERARCIQHETVFVAKVRQSAAVLGRKIAQLCLVRSINKPMADLKRLGKGRSLTIADWRKALDVKQADHVIKDELKLIERGFVEYRGRNKYVLTDLAWATEDFDAALAKTPAEVFS
jgi:hypothetical protein